MRFLAMAALALGLAGCGSTGPLTAAGTVDTICANEPALYAAYVTVAVARGTSAKKLATAAAAHAEITRICAAPPADAGQAAAALATAYAAIVAARADVQRS